MPSSAPLSRSSVIATVAGGLVLAVALTGCVAKSASASSVAVTITDGGCEVSPAHASTGSVTFTISNTGSEVNEFEILTSDQAKIVGEKENVTPGQTVTFVADLPAGDYSTACKLGGAGDLLGIAAFSVTGGAAAADPAAQARSDAAVTTYLGYVRGQIADLRTAVDSLTTAYASGNDETARTLYASTRVAYERIEPIAESFGALDQKIDFREVDAAAGGLDWTGFHRIEKDLWPPAAGALNSDGTNALLDWSASTPAERAAVAQGLVADVATLAGLVNAADFTVSAADISNGAIALLDEVAAGKISGEEEWWSHTDLWDFAANVEGARVAFDTVTELASAAGPEGSELVSAIDAGFVRVNASLSAYGSLATGFASYDTVSPAQRRELSDSVNALAEPLSRLTQVVLGVGR